MVNVLEKYFDQTFFVPESIICWPNAVCFDALIAFVSHQQTLFDEVIYGIDSIAFVKFGTSQEELIHLLLQTLEAFKRNQDNSIELFSHDIPIYYDLNVKDLNALAISLKMDKEEIIQRHEKSILKVAMIGFLPGFIYLKGLDEALYSKRKKIPSPRIAPGSVGIAETFTGIYPIQSPGGWNIIGFCPIKLFDVNKHPAIHLKIGDEVRFHAISEKEYLKMNAHGKY